MEALNEDLIAETELDKVEIESSRKLTKSQEVILEEVIKKFESLGKILFGRTNVISHDIDTGDSKPCFSRTRPTSPHKEKLIESEFLRFKELGVI